MKTHIADRSVVIRKPHTAAKRKRKAQPVGLPDDLPADVPTAACCLARIAIYLATRARASEFTNPAILLDAVAIEAATRKVRADCADAGGAADQARSLLRKYGLDLTIDKQSGTVWAGSVWGGGIFRLA